MRYLLRVNHTEKIIEADNDIEAKEMAEELAKENYIAVRYIGIEKASEK